MIINIKYKQNPHQREFHDDVTSKYLHLSTGYGGGKTHGLCQKMIKLSWINRLWPGGLMAPSYKEIKKDVIPEFEKIAEKSNFDFHFNRQDMFIQFPWTKAKLYLFTAENKLRGPNLAYFGFNEVTLMKPENFREGVGRVRIKGTRCAQICSVGTPEGIGNFIYDMFIEDPMPNSRIIYGNTVDNLDNLDENYIDLLKNSYDDITLKAYLEGQWINMNSNQFYYAYNAERNEDKSIAMQEDQSIYCAMDFNVEYMTATFWHFTGGRLFGFDEIILKDNANTHKMVEAMAARGYYRTNTTIYPDPAGRARSTKSDRSDVQILQDAGYDVRYRNVAPRMRQRQLNVNNILSKGWLKYNPNTMSHLRKDFQGVSVNPVDFGKDKSNPALTHASDGVDYMCDQLFDISGRKPERRGETIRVR